MDKELKKTIILEHYQHPKNRGLVHNSSYKTININSTSCIDQIDLEIMVKDDIIVDIKFDGEACAICTSSTSIMIDTLIGKTVEEANSIIDNFNNMIEEKEYNKELLEQAIVYSDIAKEPNRKNCALLSWNGTKKLLERGK